MNRRAVSLSAAERAVRDRTASGVFPAGRQPVDAAEPVTRGFTLTGMQEAAIQLWKRDGLDEAVARLPVDTREATFEAPALAAAWVAERHVVAWGHAIWEGPARRQRGAYERFIDRQIDLSFGRIRRFMLSVVSPATLLEKAPAIWREDHSHGDVATEVLGRNEGTWKLANHAFTSTPQLRASMAEVVRYCVSLTNARAVTAQHTLELGCILVVRVRWE
ncbi:hypothetical protein BH11MYX4_BH11MYX4_32990 [soil metagenome]